MVFLCRVQWVNIGDGTRGNFDIFEAAFPAFQLALMEDGMPVFVCLFNKKLDGQIRQWILGAWFFGMFQMIQMGLGRWTQKKSWATHHFGIHQPCWGSPSLPIQTQPHRSNGQAQYFHLGRAESAAESQCGESPGALRSVHSAESGRTPWISLGFCRIFSTFSN